MKWPYVAIVAAYLGVAGAFVYSTTLPGAADEPTANKILVPASPIGCTSVVASGNNELYSIGNPGALMQSSVSIYANEGAGPKCAPADLVFGPQRLGPGQVIEFGPLFVGAGFAYELSAPISSNLVLSYR